MAPLCFHGGPTAAARRHHTPAPPRQPAVLGGLRLVLTQLRAIPELWETAGVCKQWLLYKRLPESVDPAGGG